MEVVSIGNFSSTIFQEVSMPSGEGDDRSSLDGGEEESYCCSDHDEVTLAAAISQELQGDHTARSGTDPKLHLPLDSITTTYVEYEVW